jgi:multiple sugar transport system permease protein
MKTLDREALGAQREEARRIRARREWRTAIVKHVLLILASFGMLYPLLWMISSSFKPEAEIFGNLSLLPETIVLNNYVEG